MSKLFTAPMRLSDMLKRKRVSKRSTNNSRKGRNSIGSSEETSSQSAAASQAASAGAAGFDMPQLVHPPQTHESSSTPSRRSKLADRTSSLLSQLHPDRWVRSHHDNNSTMSGSGKI